MNTIRKSTMNSSIVGLSSGLLFLAIYLLPITDKFIEISLYVGCGLWSLIVMIMGARWGLADESRFYPSIGVFLSSAQFSSRIILGFQIYNVLTNYLIFILIIFGILVMVRMWWKTKNERIRTTLLITIGSILMYGVVEIISRIDGNNSISYHMFDWIFYSVPMIIGAFLVGYGKEILSWIVALSFVPFWGLELFPNLIPISITEQMLTLLRVSRIFIIFCFFVLNPLIRMITKGKQNFTFGLIGTSLIFIIVANFLRGFAIERTPGFLLESSTRLISILDTMIILAPVVLLYLVEQIKVDINQTYFENR